MILDSLYIYCPNVVTSKQTSKSSYLKYMSYIQNKKNILELRYENYDNIFNDNIFERIKNKLDRKKHIINKDFFSLLEIKDTEHRFSGIKYKHKYVKASLSSLKCPGC